MRRKFASNLIFLIAANLLVKPFWILGIDRVVQNQVGAQVYGTYFAVFNYSFLLSIFLDFGINNFNSRAVSRNNKRAGEYLLNLFGLKLILSALYFLFTLATAFATGYNSLQLQMLIFLAINQILLSAILYFRSNLAALHFFKTDSILSVLDRLLTIIFCLILLYSAAFQNSFSILWFIYAQTLALFITALVAFILLLNKTVLQYNIWKIKFTKLILLKSLPFALLALLMGVYYRIDAVMIERMLPNGAHEAGIYAASFRLLDALNMFGYLFATLLLPMFAHMIRRKENVSDLVKLSAQLVFVMSVTASVSCFLFRNEIMLLLYKDSTTYWAQIFGWLMLNFIPMSSIYIFGTLLTANGSLKILNFIALGGMFLNIVLNLFLIPSHGALGATIATLITQFMAAILHIIVANRKLAITYKTNELVNLFLFITISSVAIYFIHLLPLHWMGNFLLALAFCAIAAVVTQLLPISKAWNLVKQKTDT